MRVARTPKGKPGAGEREQPKRNDRRSRPKQADEAEQLAADQQRAERHDRICEECRRARQAASENDPEVACEQPRGHDDRGEAQSAEEEFAEAHRGGPGLSRLGETGDACPLPAYSISLHAWRPPRTAPQSTVDL